jgi:hypothetical protein
MPKVDRFQQNAEPAMNWPRRSMTQKEQQALIELARKWTQAALQSESSAVPGGSPPEQQQAPPLLIFYGPF